ncbi:helix-turn-helix domain-containing protein [Floridanema evergladense]|uniref:Helix-turn-helix domain-containing protein n=1 Tax=Floridaenema evergladense BLCC-F167 TaxID=3153639 RepID=A0ABV4WV92_9CYAN
MISYPQHDWHELQAQVGMTVQCDPDDPLDVVKCYSREEGRGINRSIQLRSGLELLILDAPLLYESSTRVTEEVHDGVEFHFHIQGHHDDGLTKVGEREFCIRGSGVHSNHRYYAAEQRALEVSLWLDKTVLRSMFANGAGELPQKLANWLRSENELRYARVSKVTPELERLLWEIMRCPFQGLPKRLFLEGKALEVLGIVVQMEQAMLERSSEPSLSLGTRERVYYARELVLQHLHEPLSLEELARRSQLNESTLKRGFKQEFGMTVFDYLLDYRMEQAREMLERGAMQVSEVMMAVGLKNRSYFAAAFRRKFGQNPKQYQQRFWQG